MLAVEMVRTIGLQFGVLINRSDIGNDKTEEYCLKENIEILKQIPFDRKAAEAYSRGEMLYDIDLRYADLFNNLITNIIDKGSYERISCN